MANEHRCLHRSLQRQRIKARQWDASAAERVPWRTRQMGSLGSDIDGEAAGDRAASVSLSSDGTILAVGGYKNDGNSGHTRIYQWNSETNSWVQLGNDIDGEEAGDESGYSVSLSSDGTIVAIGSPQGVNSRYGGGGHDFRIYQWDAGTFAWNKPGNTFSTLSGTDDAGQSVSLSSAAAPLSLVHVSPNRGSRLRLEFRLKHLGSAKVA